MYDIIIIGAGTAGISAYKEAIKSTDNILIVNAGPWDTTCARVGCMPSKVLISSAQRMHDIQHADEVALDCRAQIDTSVVMSHVRTLRDRFTAATMKDVDSWDATHKVSGTARFINANTIEVNQVQYQAKAFILAVGSTPNMKHEWSDALGERYISSDTVFEIPELPKSIAVIGSGVIAIELAQAMHQLGVDTTVFARSKKVGALTSPELQALACEIFSQSMQIKFEVLPDTVALKNADSEQKKVSITYTDNGTQNLEVDYLLSAMGRTSNLSTLNLACIDPSFNHLKQLPVHPKTKQLADLPIFVVGDAHTEKPLQHEAAYEGRMAVQSCLNLNHAAQERNITGLSIVFSAPEMAISGQSFKQLTTEKIDFVTGRVSFERQGRALVLGKNQGAAEVYVDRASRKLLGAELLVDSAEHMAHLLSWMISEQISIDDILKKPFYHPTLEEGLRTALRHARRQLDQI